MSQSQNAHLVDRLVERTNAGKVDWKATVDDDAFVVSFKNNAVRLSRTEAIRATEAIYKVELIDSQGNVVESFTDADLDTELLGTINSHYYQRLQSLYADARRRALGADKVAKAILEALEADEDEIPF